MEEMCSNHNSYACMLVPLKSHDKYDNKFEAVLNASKREDYLQSNKAYKEWRNKCFKVYRRSRQDLVMQLDCMLPESCRSAPKRNMGARGIGTKGRSQLLVLEDARTYLRSLLDAGILPAASARRHQGATREDCITSLHRESSTQLRSIIAEQHQGVTEVDFMYRESLMQSRSIFALELENPWAWTVTRASQGAMEFFRDAPFDSIVGQSLAHLVRCEDLLVMRQMWHPLCGTNAGYNGSQQRLHVIDFSAGARHMMTFFPAIFWSGSTTVEGPTSPLM